MDNVGQILSRKYGYLTKVIRLRQNWNEIAGEVLAAHSEPVQIKGKTLFVLCDSPVWVQQIGILSPTLQPRIKKIAGIRIEKITGTFGMAYKTTHKVRPRPLMGKLDIDPADVERIADPELKRAIQSLVDIQEDRNG
ncbi:MAG TPA: DUF721 domain-containing protein [Deltaproteobacteria bacterium]|nr:DUF721 domain-containing protein [Deltaproteobacteria bacterium]